MFMAHYWGYLAVFAILISACSPSTSLSDANAAPPPTAQTSGQFADLGTDGLLKSLKRQGAAPELFSQVWLNSPPLKLADLRGKVVVIDFWTFG